MSNSGCRHGSSEAGRSARPPWCRAPVVACWPEPALSMSRFGWPESETLVPVCGRFASGRDPDDLAVLFGSIRSGEGGVAELEHRADRPGADRARAGRPDRSAGGPGSPALARPVGSGAVLVHRLPRRRPPDQRPGGDGRGAAGVPPGLPRLALPAPGGRLLRVAAHPGRRQDPALPAPPRPRRAGPSPGSTSCGAIRPSHRRTRPRGCGPRRSSPRPPSRDWRTCTTGCPSPSSRRGTPPGSTPA